MEETERLHVSIKYDGVRADFSGNVNKVFEEIVKFLTSIYPKLEVLQKIIYEPDLMVLAEKISGLLELTSNGPILVSDFNYSARNAICIVLLGAYLGSRFGKIGQDALSSKDLARITGKARKTISNEIPRLVSEGFIQRKGDGEYNLTVFGIRKTEDEIKKYKLEQNL